MKGGLSSAIEAMRALRDAKLLPGGGILLTAHDHLEGPWGDGRQAEALICDGYVGDGVLVPEYLADRLPGAGRGMAIFEVPLTRSGEPVHEVLRPEGLLDVLGAGAELVCRLRELDTEVGFKVNDVSGRDSLFVGQIDAGEIYNQATRDVPRAWHASLGDARRRAAAEQLRSLAVQVAAASGADVEVDFDVMGDAFQLDPGDTLVGALQAACTTVGGAPLPWGDKPFLDDANRFCCAGVSAVTHGPAATGAHTTCERVAVEELVRAAQVYAMTAIGFCAGHRSDP